MDPKQPDITAEIQTLLGAKDFQIIALTKQVKEQNEMLKAFEKEVKTLKGE